MLKGEEKSMLIDLATHEGFKVLLKVVDKLASLQEQVVAKTTIQVGKETEVLYAKARAEGARKLQTALRIELQKLRIK